MPKYRVRVARDASESCDVIVEADSAMDANQIALQRADECPELVTDWDVDEGNTHHVYLPDENSTEEVFDVGSMIDYSKVAADYAINDVLAAAGDVTIGEDFDEFLNEATLQLHGLWIKYGGNTLNSDEIYALNDAVTAFFDGKRNALI